MTSVRDRFSTTSEQPIPQVEEKSKSGSIHRKNPITWQNVSLVSELATYLISPQFHVKHDPSFDVVQQQSFKSNWKNKDGFVADREQKIEKRSNLPI